MEGAEGHLFKGKKKESEKKSGSAAVPVKKWKYSAVLSFLDPFVTPRETSGNMVQNVQEDRTAEYRSQQEAEDEDQGPEAAAESDIGGLLISENTHTHSM